MSAKDLGTGKEQAIKITAKSGLTEDEINRMVREAEANAEEDKKKREEINTVNNLDNLVYQTEKLIKEKGGDLSQTEKIQAEAAINDAKEVLKSRPGLAQIQTALNNLTQASHRLSTTLYEKSKKGGGEGGGTPGGDSGSGGGETGKGKDDVIDADYKDRLTNA